MTTAANSKRQRLEKADVAFRTISEVSQTLEVQQHVLRFWETKFAQIKPVKRGGGRRYYRPEDISLLQYIHKLLYSEGYTIKGVQKLLKTHTKAELMQAAAANASGVLSTASSPSVAVPKDAAVARQLRQKRILQAMLGDLVELRDNVRKVREACASE